MKKSKGVAIRDLSPMLLSFAIFLAFLWSHPTSKTGRSDDKVDQIFEDFEEAEFRWGLEQSKTQAPVQRRMELEEKVNQNLKLLQAPPIDSRPDAKFRDQ